MLYSEYREKRQTSSEVMQRISEEVKGRGTEKK